MKVKEIAVELKSRDADSPVVVEVTGGETPQYYQISGVRFDSEHRKVVLETELLEQTEPVPTPLGNA